MPRDLRLGGARSFGLRTRSGALRCVQLGLVLLALGCGGSRAEPSREGAGVAAATGMGAPPTAAARGAAGRGGTAGGSGAGPGAGTPSGAAAHSGGAAGVALTPAAGSGAALASSACTGAGTGAIASNAGAGAGVAAAGACLSAGAGGGVAAAGACVGAGASACVSAEAGARVAAAAGAGVSAGARAAAGGGAPQPPLTAGPNEWRTMGYDERNWYFNPQEKGLSAQNARQLIEKWRFTISGIPMGALSIADGKVFATATGGTYAIDLETGKQVWARTDLGGNAAPGYSAGFVYVQTSLPPQVYKLSALDGKTVWGPIRNCNDDSSCSGESSPTIVGDTVYVGMESNMAEASFAPGTANGKRGGVRALAADSGELRWLYQTVQEPNSASEDGASVWSSISVDVPAGLVFATTGNSYTVAGPNANAFHAIDLASGARRWVKQVRQGDVFTAVAALAGKDSTKFDFDFGANPILAEVGGKRVVAAGDKGGAFWVLERETGEILWRRDDLAPSADATTGGILMNGAFDGRAFYVVSNDARSGGAVLHRLDGATGASAWSHPFKELTWGAPSLANGVLFVPNNSTLYALNADTGEVLTQLETGGTMVAAAPAIAQGTVVVKSGFLYTVPSTMLNDQVICYALPGTSNASTGSAGQGHAAAAPAAASFSAIFQGIIVGTGCSSGQCHSLAAAGALDLTTQEAAYRNLVSVPAKGRVAPSSAAASCSSSGLLRVAPGEPDRSLLVSKLEHTQTCGAPMPNAGTRLPVAQLQLLRDWIQAGARND